MVEINKRILEALEQSQNKLSSGAVDHIKKFLLTQQHPNGGFIDRAGKPDPYYSVFGYTLAFVFDIKLNIEKEQLFIQQWEQNNEVDFVHAMSLLRCSLLISAIKYKSKNKGLAKQLPLTGFFYNQIKNKIIKETIQENTALLKFIELYRSKDKGFNHNAVNSENASVYATFLAWSLFQDLVLLDDEKGLHESIKNLHKPDGSYVNDYKSTNGVTTATAAGLIMSLSQNDQMHGKSTLWLQSKWLVMGGFVAADGVPIPDLLSTSTALLALNAADLPMKLYADDCEEFIGLHWDSSGGFFGSAVDMVPDCEYTYYALLALGLL